MSVSTPTLRWVTVGSLQEQVAIGQDDHVLDSVFDPQRGVWSVLVLVQPTEQSEDGE
jgi:hypothetical protein